MVKTAAVGVGHRGHIVIHHTLNTILVFNFSRPPEGGLFSCLNAYAPLKRRAIPIRACGTGAILLDVVSMP